MIMYLVIINILAAFGIVYILYIIDEINNHCKSKRKEKFKRDVSNIIKELQEENNA